MEASKHKKLNLIKKPILKNKNQPMEFFNKFIMILILLNVNVIDEIILIICIKSV